MHTCMLLGTPSTITCTFLTFARWRCSARREICERVIWIFLPKNISFEQISHLAMLYLLTFSWHSIVSVAQKRNQDDNTEIPVAQTLFLPPQHALKIGDDIFRVFQTDGDAHQTLGDPGRLQLFSAVRRMCHGRRLFDQRLGVTE